MLMLTYFVMVEDLKNVYHKSDQLNFPSVIYKQFPAIKNFENIFKVISSLVLRKIFCIKG